MLTNQEQDHALTIKALAKIVRAQERGTLSSGVFVRRLPIQIVLERTTAEDLAWIKKHFPGDEELHLEGTRRAVGSSRRKRLYDEHRYLANLREPTDRDPSRTWVPKIEVWGILKPHECRRWSGYAQSNGNVSWRCTSHSCQKKITLTRARELGLMPPRNFS